MVSKFSQFTKFNNSLSLTKVRFFALQVRLLQRLHVPTQKFPLKRPQALSNE